MREHQVEGPFGKWKGFAVGHTQIGREALLLEIGSSQIDRGAGEIHACANRPALREPSEVDSGAASDVEDCFAAVRVEIDETKQVVELFEVILIQVVEKPAGADGMPRDLEVVNVMIPVRANVGGRCHGQTISHGFVTMAAA